MNTFFAIVAALALNAGLDELRFAWRVRSAQKRFNEILSDTSLCDCEGCHESGDSSSVEEFLQGIANTNRTQKD